MQKQASVGSASLGDSVTYTLSLTVSGGPVSDVILQDTLPAGVTFTSFLSAPLGTTPSQNGQNLQWALPTLPIGPYQITYSVKLATALTGVLTNNVQLTSPTLPTETASSNVTVAGNYTVQIAVYNEAGELVKLLLAQSFSEPVNDFFLPAGNAITALQGNGSTIPIDYKGLLIGTWDGYTQGGNLAADGTYLLKVDSIDPHGVATSVTRPVIVNRKLSKVAVDIFNEAGEVVRHLFAFAADSSGDEMTNVALSSGILAPGAAGTGSAPSTIQIVVQTTGLPVTIIWDGTQDGGSLVTAGDYQIGVSWEDGSGGKQEISRGILVVGGGRPGGGIFAAPNLLTLGTGVSSTNFQISSANPHTLKVSVYTLAGELVAVRQGAVGTNSVVWNATGAASGIYLAAVDVLNANGELTQKKLLKVLVIR